MCEGLPTRNGPSKRTRLVPRCSRQTYIGRYFQINRYIQIGLLPRIQLGQRKRNECIGYDQCDEASIGFRFQVRDRWAQVRLFLYIRGEGANGRMGDVPDLTADPTLAEKELGFVATENLETMCRDLWNFQTKFPSGW
jgi:hypothetical protein